ncbi:unnamed protein product [Blepharisma stoltei]|uniref:Telomeric single stranded DNA binding POT1/Cdc13 domain-containing protein n=1 Tax=Blepharisma stoltei TaxID=1481888 RepID=A0AAU9JKA5_9CILI|nr:unnamed protein product [Blepharisma stoltei]
MMHIKHITPGVQAGPLEVTVDSRSGLHDSLMRITVKDFTGRVNIILEGNDLVKAFEKISPDTKLTLSNFHVSENYDMLSNYFPAFIQGTNVAIHGSDLAWFIHISHDKMPSIRFTHKSSSYSINPDTQIESIDLSQLYAHKEQTNSSPQKLLGPNNERFSSLQFIKDSCNQNTPIIASCYAVVFDSTSSYMPSNTTDYMIKMKITDQSIFPGYATLTVFHKNPQSMVKVAGIGDIIKIEQFSFKIHKGGLTATGSSSSKSSKFFLFALEEDKLSPYANYGGQFHQISEHYHFLESLRKWVTQQFAQKLPTELEATTALSNITTTSESDILVRIYGVYKMGVAKSDPSAIICYDTNNVTQIIVPAEREKLLKWLQPGLCVRVRSVVFENGRISLTYYSDIHIVPEWMGLCQIPMISEKEREMQRIAEAYIQPEKKKVRTIVSQNMKSAPIVSFSRLKYLNYGIDFRVEGFVVKILPNHPRELEGMICRECGKKTSLDFCDKCNIETDIKCQLNLFVWDGSENEDNIVKLIVSEDNCFKFTNLLEWNKMKELVLDPESMMEFGVRVSDLGFEVVETSLLI